MTLQTITKRLERLEAGEWVNDKRHDVGPIRNESSRENLQTGFTSTIQARLTKLQDRITHFVFDKIESELEQFIFKDNGSRDTNIENISVSHDERHIISGNRVQEAASDTGVQTDTLVSAKSVQSVNNDPSCVNEVGTVPVPPDFISERHVAAASACAMPVLKNINSVLPATLSKTSVVSTAMHCGDGVEGVPNRNSVDRDSEHVSVVPSARHFHGQPLIYLPADASVKRFPDQHIFLHHVINRNILR
ncbi:hypothetical protein DPMN_164964 [Dreissena polymorpha]|uniref:Uncharacterized protein n=1 Tax=Dreissena polymorpha TaxID=45954 RepID=A0A9D4EYR7_DREPO|nr:hypothetical protein DPMN_164964 [Dreissena polymorpha]